VVSLNGFDCLAQIVLVRDVVAPEHAGCFVPGDLHRDRLRDAAADHVPNTCSPEVMKDSPAVFRFAFASAAPAGGPFVFALGTNHFPQAGSDACRRPGFAKLLDGLSVAMKDQFRQNSVGEPGLFDP